MGSKLPKNKAAAPLPHSNALRAVLPTAFYFGSRWGPVGIASGWVMVYLFLTLPFYWRVFPKIEMLIREYLGALLPAFDGSVLMVLSVGMLKWTLLSG